MKKKIFFVGNIGHGSTFIDNDYKELQKHFEVRPFKNSLFDIIRNVFWCDTIYGWFASWRMIYPIIFAKILSKRIVVVAGGYDVVNAPEINYGAWIKIPDRRISKFVFKYADIVLPVSEYIKNELLEKMSVKETKVIYNGVNINEFYPQGEKDDRLVITVGEINWSNLKRKGIENFIRTARYLPDVNFVVIGEKKDSSMDYLKNIATDNVLFTGFVTNKDLLGWYQRAKVYAQLSYHEGFGLSVAEAMLCGCIPVTTSRGALPEVTGKQKYKTFYNYPAISAYCIEKVLKEKNVGMIYRYRIMKHFSLKKRIDSIRRLLE